MNTRIANSQNLYQIANGNFDRLKFLLSRNYSIGQLQLWYMDLTSGAPLTDMTAKERADRTEAIRQLLNLPVEQAAEAVVVEESKPTVQFPLDKATRLAKGLVQLLEDYCDRIHIAGSIRRQKEQVKDIEIVCQPHRLATSDFALFAKTLPPEVVSGFKKTVERDIGEILKGKCDGRYMQFLLPSGMKLDLFMPAPHDYFRQLAIRTGPAQYSSDVIAKSWKAKGWCGTSQGLRRIDDCQELSSGGWKCLNLDPELPPVWASEEEFFKWLGLRWLDAPKRI